MLNLGLNACEKPVGVDVQPAFLDGYERKTDISGAHILKMVAAYGGSDAPVESFDPMPAIYSAVTREDLNGLPEGGMQPEEQLNVYQAICLLVRIFHMQQARTLISARLKLVNMLT